jgi:hypothetical protein
MANEVKRTAKTKTRASYRDPATGLYSLDLFLLELDREFQRSLQSGDPFTVALLQADPPPGDKQILKELGALIEGNIRPAVTMKTCTLCCS